MLIEYVWGAVGVAFGVCFATTVLVITELINDYLDNKKK